MLPRQALPSKCDRGRRYLAGATWQGLPDKCYRVGATRKSSLAGVTRERSAGAAIQIPWRFTLRVTELEPGVDVVAEWSHHDDRDAT